MLSLNTKRKKEIIGTIIAIIILIVIVIISNVKINNFSYAESVFNFFVMPVQNGLTFLKNKLAGNDSFFADVSNLRNENAELKSENEELKKSLREFEVMKAENETLKEYVNLKDKYSDYAAVPGYVINKDISNYSRTVIINIGKADGIDINMPVISENGLVGHIISVTDHTAKVQTIVDTSSSISCTLVASRDTIVAKGTLESQSLLRATYIPTDAVISQGDSIETSGLGGIYPKGILVGSVSKVVNTRNITDRYAVVETAVDFAKLETVLVITQ